MFLLGAQCVGAGTCDGAALTTANALCVWRARRLGRLLLVHGLDCRMERVELRQGLIPPAYLSLAGALRGLLALAARLARLDGTLLGCSAPVVRRLGEESARARRIHLFEIVEEGEVVQRTRRQPVVSKVGCGPDVRNRCAVLGAKVGCEIVRHSLLLWRRM